MHMLYNSPSFIVVQFEVPVEGLLQHDASQPELQLSRGGFEIVDKYARREIFIEGALAEQFHAFKPAVEQVARELQGGASVLLHCAAGIGRTGTMAACVLKQLGVPREEALWRVRDAGSSPESAVQSGLVDEF